MIAVMLYSSRMLSYWYFTLAYYADTSAALA